MIGDDPRDPADDRVSCEACECAACDGRGWVREGELEDEDEDE